MSNWQKIERSREARLWISQVIIPVVTAGGVILSVIPEKDREAIKAKAVEVKEKAKDFKDKIFHGKKET